MTRAYFLLFLLSGCTSQNDDTGEESVPSYIYPNAIVQMGNAGIRIETEEGSLLSLRTERIGREDQLQDQGDAPALPAACAPVGPRLWLSTCGPTFERSLPQATERWTLQSQGLRQGWTLWERPEGDGPLQVEVTVTGATLGQDGPDITLWTDEGSQWRYTGLKAWDAHDHLISAWMEVDDSHIRISVDDTDATWPITIDPVLSTATTTLSQSATDFGIGVGSGGDVNNDGYDDVIVGARFGTGLYGEAFSYHGSASGISTAYNRMWRGAMYYGKFGEYVDNGGDINGDGYDDAIVGEFYADRILAYHGSATGLSATATTTLSGTYAQGRDLHIIGDWNNDGYDDIVTGSTSAAVIFYRGSSSGLVSTAVSQVSTTDAPSVAPAGDVNNDGYDDVIYGDRAANLAYVVRGAASFPGTTTTLSRSSSVSFGYDVSGGGDINGDGYDDVLVGDPDYASVTGRVVVYYGSSTGISTTNYAVLSAPVAGSGFGATVLLIGDINGDGYDDVAVSDDYSHNEVYVYHGSSSGLESSPINSLSGGGQLGYSLSSGDVNNDGYRDLVLGEINVSTYIYHGCPDTDRDGYCTDRDCNDNDAAINPAATEICDSIDNDCDGLTDDADSGVSGRSTFYRDRDGDTYGISSSTTTACLQPSGYVSTATDCNDNSAAINPAATEICDSVDNDCDGLTDDADTNVSGRSTFYRDNDSDTYGSATTTTAACTRPTGYVSNATDCNDSSAAINPAATESCDSVDNDCDGLIDDADSAVSGRSTFYLDNDGDSYGSSSTSSTACLQPSGYVSTSTDCNDNSAAINPAATEICDSVDNDCDSLIDDADSTVSGRSTFYLDNDGDSYGSSTSSTACLQPSGYVSTSTDCNDNSAAINPAATEICDSVDNDCDGLIDDADTNVSGRGTWYADSDGDNYGNLNSTAAACLQPSGYVSTSTDCNDALALIHPGVAESCDSVDNDCDGLIDDADSGVVGQPTWYADSDGDSYGNAASSALACLQPSNFVGTASDCDDASAAINPAATEICDGVDNDCDRLIDDADNSVVGQGTWYEDRDGDTFGSAISMSAACIQPLGYVATDTDCDDAAAAINTAATEICDGVDNDCDGLTDDADSTVTGQGTWYVDDDGDGYGSTSTTQVACVAPDGYVEAMTDCDDGDALIHPDLSELCDGFDNNCDGLVDEADPTLSDGVTWYADADGDGFGDVGNSVVSCSLPDGFVTDASDCNDNDRDVRPGAIEVCGGGDENCDGLVDDSDPTLDPTSAQTWFEDEDGDGQGSESKVVLACEVPDGAVAQGQDCNDSDPTIYGGAPELKDGKDNNCDGIVDAGDGKDATCGCAVSGGANALWLALLPAVVLRRRSIVRDTE